MFFLVIRTCFYKDNASMFKIFNKRNRLILPASVLSPRVAYSGIKDCPCGSSSGSGKHKVTFTPYQAPPKRCHDERNMNLKRPMSPHLTIYAPTLPAMTSIVQRITGLILTFYALMLSCGSLFLSNGVETYVSIIQSLDLSRPSIFIIKLVCGAPFVYHYFNGIRFCMWNAGKWLAIKDVYATAKQSFVATAAVTLFFALI